MSPVTLSAPSTQTVHPNPQRKGVRFGRDAEPETPKGPETDKVEINQTTETAPTEGVNNSDANEPKTPEAPKTPEKPSFFKQLGERLSKFFKRIGKAFQKLFASEKPKTEVDTEVKQFKTNMKQHLKQLRTNLQTENLQTRLRASAKELEDNGTPEEKKDHADFIEAAKTDEGLKPYIAEIQKSAAGAIHLLNNPEEFLKKMSELAEVFAAPETKDVEVQTEPEIKPANK